jgi:hypothetical protein
MPKYILTVTRCGMHAGGTESEAAPDAKRQKKEPAVDAEGAATVGRVDADATAAEQPSGAATAYDAAADTAAAAAAATEGAEDVGASEGAEDGKEAAETVQPADPTVLAFRCCSCFSCVVMSPPLHFTHGRQLKSVPAHLQP